MPRFFFSSRRRHTRFDCDWSSDVCSSDLAGPRDGGVTLRTDALPAQFDHTGAVLLSELACKIGRAAVGDDDFVDPPQRLEGSGDLTRFVEGRDHDGQWELRPGLRDGDGHDDTCLLWARAKWKHTCGGGAGLFR